MASTVWPYSSLLIARRHYSVGFIWTFAGIPGVDNDKTLVQNLEGSAPRLAGCFGLPDSVSVWDLIDKDQATKEIINGHIAHGKNKYGQPDGPAKLRP
ncbi:hypothetical protein CNMCM6106_002126 [Aspergillus hiratsukae]|uniref:Uncharacterized protein n=1 Tax=Aspergillus hiratsukae TaxID=1194566 RepID=A0A8H6Q3A6_9EURO|nr:hypothetical protein CNMCM6106_002126 [Aspergillus hiratsukae]